MRQFIPVTILTALFALPAFAAGEGGHSHSADAMMGTPGDPADAARTVEVVMTDNAFSVPSLEVKEGETIRFVLRNDGEFLHEFNIATAHMHEEHQEEMMHMMEHSAEMTAASMEADHHDANSILLDPGQTGELTWTFGKAMELEFACNVPGHYQSGMVGQFHMHGH